MVLIDEISESSKSISVLRYGFVVERENQVDMDGVVLTNYVMRCAL